MMTSAFALPSLAVFHERGILTYNKDHKNELKESYQNIYRLPTFKHDRQQQ